MYFSSHAVFMLCVVVEMRVGLIGCGRVANIHMAAYERLTDVNVVAVSDIKLGKAKSFANIYGISKVFSDYKGLFNVDNLDYVDICTPTSTHNRIVCDAARSGHDILVEKPMARNISECEKMISESEKNGVRLCICHNQLFHPEVMKAKSLVDSGNYDLTYFRTTHRENFDLLKAVELAQSWNVTPREGGILWEVGTHLVYLQLHFLPKVKEVYAVGTRAKYPVYDEIAVLLKAQNQRYGLIEISWVAKETEITYEIGSADGKRAEIIFDYDLLIEKSENPPMSVPSVAHNIYTDMKRGVKKWMKFGLNYISKRKLLPHFNLISNYVESLKNNSALPVTPEDGKNTIKVLECIDASLKKGRVIEVS